MRKALILLVIAISPLCAADFSELRPALKGEDTACELLEHWLPAEAGVIHMRRNFDPHQLHYALAKLTLHIRAEQPELINEWRDLLSELHATKLVIQDAIEGKARTRPLDTRPELELLAQGFKKKDIYIQKVRIRTMEEFADIALPMEELICLAFSVERDGVLLAELELAAYLHQPTIYLAWDGCRLVGVAWAIPPDDDQYWELSDVCTHPHYPGQHIGSTLLQEIAANPEIDQIFLYVAKENVGARRLYERMGFTSRDPEELDCWDTATFDPLHWLGLIADWSDFTLRAT